MDYLILQNMQAAPNYVECVDWFVGAVFEDVENEAVFQREALENQSDKFRVTFRHRLPC